MLYGVVLAGGRSSRMGRDKRWLVHNGKPLLEHARQLLVDSGVTQPLLSGDIPGYDSIVDQVADAGPPGALHATLEHIAATQGLKGEGLLVIPVDMPALYPALLSRLVNELPLAAAAQYADEIFPCAFRLDETLLAYIRQGIYSQSNQPSDKKSFSMRRILKHLEARTVSLAGIDTQVFRNMNTPGDWDNFQSLV